MNWFSTSERTVWFDAWCELGFTQHLVEKEADVLDNVLPFSPVVRRSSKPPNHSYYLSLFVIAEQARPFSQDVFCAASCIRFTSS